MAHGYLFRQMDDADAREISGWRYVPPYAFYDATADPADPADPADLGNLADLADLAELLDPERRRGIFFSVLDGKKDEAVDVGLGLEPDLTGKDLGAQFFTSGLAFARERFSPRPFTLSVATRGDVQRACDRRLRAGRFSAGQDLHARDQRRRARVRVPVARGVTGKRPHGRRFAGPGAVIAWCLPRRGRG